MNVYEKLQACRCELQSKKLKKSGKNSYSGFEYFELRDFLPTLNKIFNDKGLCSNFSIANDNASLRVINTEKPEEVIEFTSPIEDLDLNGCNKIQALGGVHTYMKRYLYLNALEIVEADLFDNVSGSGKLEEKEPDQPKEDFSVDAALLEISEINDIKRLVGYFNANQKNFQGNKYIMDAFKKRRAELSQNGNN